MGRFLSKIPLYACACMLHTLMSVKNVAFTIEAVDITPEFPVNTLGDTGGAIDVGSTVRDTLYNYR